MNSPISQQYEPWVNFVFSKFGKILYAIRRMSQSQGDNQSSMSSSISDAVMKQSQSSISAIPQPTLSSQSFSHSNSNFTRIPGVVSADKSMNLGKIKEDPFQFITDETSRDTLFQIIYMLERENRNLIGQLELNREFSEKVGVGGATSLMQAPGRQASIKYIETKNREYSAANKLLLLYRDQQEKLDLHIRNKEKSIKRLKDEMKAKEHQFKELDKLLKHSEDKLILLKEKKAKLMDDITRKKNNEKLADSGLIDKLLREYFETIQEAMDDSSSVQRIHNNAKAALGEVGQTKNVDLFSAFLEEMEQKQNK